MESRYSSVLRKYARNLKRKLKLSLSFFSDNIVNIIVLIIVIGIFVAAFEIQIASKNASSIVDSEFWINTMLPNIMADMIGIVFTSFFIAGLFTRNNKRSQLKIMHSVFGQQYNKLISMLCRNILVIVKRDDIYLSFQKDDRTVYQDLSLVVKDIEGFIDYSSFNRSFRIWDVTSGSSLWDTYIDMIPKIEKYNNDIWVVLGEIDLLAKEEAKYAIFLSLMDQGSTEYQSTLETHNKYKNELKSKSRLLLKFPKNNELSQVELKESLDALRKFFNSSIQEFIKMNGLVLPMEIRYSFAQVQKALNRFIYSMKVYYFPNEYNHLSEGNIESLRIKKKKESLTAIIDLSEELLNLSKYFNTVDD
ncbi:hypothetical protein [Peribacillus deserti]|uniref:Uncharacterized protein n=1 Tax=Peribacillus deserti TaxID=673318 RepID=A0A2N5M637_9BACI|nr:hypothetical protein [Peribacillus deserti]PLT29828.1 hypothetical protein CUU66_11030 [Peribacillus deserti]